MTIVETIVSESLKKYEDEAMRIIISQKCESCSHKGENCFPCETIAIILPEIEEILASKEAKSN